MDGFKSKINLSDNKVFQSTGDTLTLSGSTFVKNLKYITNNSQNYTNLSVANAGYVTGQTNNRLLISEFNIYTGNTNTILNSKVNNSLFNSFTGTNQTNLFNKLDKTLFISYTGDTNNKINHISGVTNTKLDKTLFNSFTGTNQTNLFNKVDKIVFNTYTGNTQTILNNKMNIVTGTTQNNVVIFGSNGTFADSGISKALIYAGLVM